jgi:NAD(P)-dependent dehydrogenase (short-subunit alcohol dehydrogenase family)
MKNSRHVIVVSISSDIGTALGHHYLDAGWQVSGTYRRETSSCMDLQKAGADIKQCDLVSPSSIADICEYFYTQRPTWDLLIFCPGNLEPIGPFIECDFDQWQESVDVNFTNQLRIVHLLHACRTLKGSPLVLFFAGGGVNNATLNYSAYTVAKIALIKMCELLDAEVDACRFSILGPGWVRTKIHEATLQAGLKAGSNFQRTKEMLDHGTMTPMTDIIKCCEWLFSMPKEVISGRNFSVVYDAWREDTFAKILKNNENMYKLRRLGN